MLPVFVFETVFLMFWILAGATPWTDEEELGGTVQRAGGEEASVWGREGQLGGSAENPRAAETGCLQVSISSLHIFNDWLVFRTRKCNILPVFLIQDDGKEQEERKNLLKRDTWYNPSVLHALFLCPLWSSYLQRCMNRYSATTATHSTAFLCYILHAPCVTGQQ